jgi:hypothetical protein
MKIDFFIKTKIIIIRTTSISGKVHGPKIKVNESKSLSFYVNFAWIKQIA